MPTVAQLKERLDDLLKTGRAMTHVGSAIVVRQSSSEQQRRYLELRERAKAGAWFASVSLLIEALTPSEQTPHRKYLDQLSGDRNPEYQVIAACELLEALKKDIDCGLMASIENQAVAMTFETLIDHAAEYLQHDQVHVAGVVAGVAFEDTLRRIREIEQIQPEAISLENLIAELERRPYLSKADARHARSAAALRTSATHARWDEFNRHSVDACIRFTRELLSRFSNT